MSAAAARDQQQHPHQQQHQQAAQQQPADAGQQPAALGRLVARGAGSRVHFCFTCHAPIAVYGRLMPCMHTFCLACATDMAKCFICEVPVKHITRVALPRPVFISPVTLQGFPSEQEMASHTQRLHSHIMSTQQPLIRAVNQQQQRAAAAAAAAAATAQYAQQRGQQRQQQQQQQQQPAQR